MLSATPFREQHKLALTQTEKGVGGPDAQRCKIQISESV